MAQQRGGGELVWVRVPYAMGESPVCYPTKERYSHDQVSVYTSTQMTTHGPQLQPREDSCVRHAQACTTRLVRTVIGFGDESNGFIVLHSKVASINNACSQPALNVRGKRRKEQRAQCTTADERSPALGVQDVLRINTHIDCVPSGKHCILRETVR